MPNESGAWPSNGAFQAGRELSAAQLQRVVNSLASRIIGDGKTIKVRTFPSGQICIEGTRDGGGLGAASSGIQSVTVLPPIPESGMLEVIWLAPTAPPGTPGTGTGDGQIWRSHAGASRWYPTEYTTSLSGLVVEADP